MALPDAWLTAVLRVGGDFEPPPDPQIPAEYLQKPQRQRPASVQTQWPSSHLPSPPTSFRRAAFTEIDPRNDSRPRKRRRGPIAPTSIMSHASPSPSKMSSRKAARKADDTRRNLAVENVKVGSTQTVGARLLYLASIGGE